MSPLPSSLALARIMEVTDSMDSTDSSDSTDNTDSTDGTDTLDSPRAMPTPSAVGIDTLAPGPKPTATPATPPAAGTPVTPPTRSLAGVLTVSVPSPTATSLVNYSGSSGSAKTRPALPGASGPSSSSSSSSASSPKSLSLPPPRPHPRATTTTAAIAAGATPSSLSPSAASSSALVAEAAASARADRTTVIVAIVLLVLGVVAILTAAAITFVWRKRRGTQSVSGAFVAYMRERRADDDAVSVASSIWPDGASLHNGTNLWYSDEENRYLRREGDVPVLGVGYPAAAHAAAPSRLPIAAQYHSLHGHGLPSPTYPSYPLYRSSPHPAYGDPSRWPPGSGSGRAGSAYVPIGSVYGSGPTASDPPPDYIPYRGPIEPPLPHPCPDASWMNRPLPPLPHEMDGSEYRQREASESGRDAAFNSLGLSLWGSRMSVMGARVSNIFVPNATSSSGHSTTGQSSRGFSRMSRRFSAVKSTSPTSTSTSSTPAAPSASKPAPPRISFKAPPSDPSPSSNSPPSSAAPLAANTAGPASASPAPNVARLSAGAGTLVSDSLGHAGGPRSNTASIVSDISWSGIESFKSTSPQQEEPERSESTWPQHGHQAHRGDSSPRPGEQERVSRASRASHMSHSSSTSRPESSLVAATPTAVTGFALNGRRSTATMYPSDAVSAVSSVSVSEEQVSSVSRARSATPNMSTLARCASYRFDLLAKQRNARGNDHNLPVSNTLAPITLARPIPATLAGVGVLRRHSTTKSLKSKSAMSVRFESATATSPYPFAGFGSEDYGDGADRPRLSGPAARLKRSLSQPGRDGSGSGGGSGGASADRTECLAPCVLTSPPSEAHNTRDAQLCLPASSAGAHSNRSLCLPASSV